MSDLESSLKHKRETIHLEQFSLSSVCFMKMYLISDIKGETHIKQTFLKSFDGKILHERLHIIMY